MLTTTRRTALLLFVFLIWTPAAYAWSRPVQGPIVQPFVYDEAHPYAAGQHRGVDLGAESAGETVVAPAAGTVSFAGTVPTSGKSVTIETADGYSVTLTHLGSIAVVERATVAEQQAVGTVGPSGTPEVDGPYVHLGIRATADPNGYIDPLSLLPPTVESGADQGGSTVTQPTSSGAAAAPPAKKPTPSAPAAKKPASAPPARPDAGTGHAKSGQRSSWAHEQGRARESRGESRTNARPRHSSTRARARERRAPRKVARPRSRPAARSGSLRRPFVEPAASESRASPPAARPRLDTDALVGLACNGTAALVAVAAALAASRRRRRAHAIPVAGGQVLHLAPPATGRRHVSRAA